MQALIEFLFGMMRLACAVGAGVGFALNTAPSPRWVYAALFFALVPCFQPSYRDVRMMLLEHRLRAAEDND